MSVHPGADQSRRYDVAYPGSYVGGPWRIVLHTTEGGGLPGYSGGAVAPHFTLSADGSLWQHFDTDRPSRALENRAGGVETNRLHAIQIELIGTSGWDLSGRLYSWPDADGDALQHLADLLAWIASQHPINLDAGPSFRPYSVVQRLSGPAWQALDGICGHAHVPENTHVDPGALPMDQIRALLNQPTPPMEDDIMALTDDDISRIAAAVWQHTLGERGGAGPGSATDWLRDTSLIVRDIAGRQYVEAVTSIYREVLGRTPDPEGLAYWTRRLASGMTVDDVTSAFAASDEAAALRASVDAR